MKIKSAKLTSAMALCVAAVFLTTVSNRAYAAIQPAPAPAITQPKSGKNYVPVPPTPAPAPVYSGTFTGIVTD